MVVWRRRKRRCARGRGTALCAGEMRGGGRGGARCLFLSSRSQMKAKTMRRMRTSFLDGVRFVFFCSYGVLLRDVLIGLSFADQAPSGFDGPQVYQLPLELVHPLFSDGEPGLIVVTIAAIPLVYGDP